MYLDVSRYTRAPRISAVTGVLLTIRMLEATPKVMGPPVHKAAVRMRDAGEELQVALQERERVRSFSLRPLDQGFDGAYAAMYMRIHAHTRVRHGVSAKRARTLLRKLFPTKLAFLKLGYEAEWIHSKTLLERVKAEKLEPELVELAGKYFVTEVRKAHDALGEGLGIGGPDPKQAPPLADAITKVAHAIANYGRVLAGSIDDEDPESVAMFEAAMAPRDAHLARQRRLGGGGVEALEDAGDDEGETEDDAEDDAEDELEDDDEAKLLAQLDTPLPPVPELIDG